MSASTFFVSLPDLDQHCLVCGASMRGFSASCEPCFDWLAKPGSAFQHVPVCRPSIWSSSERCYDGSAGHGSSQTGSARPEARTAADKYWGTIAAKSQRRRNLYFSPQPLLVGRNLMFAKGRRGNLVFSDLIFSHLVLSLLLFSHPFIALGAGGRGFIPNQPKRYYDAFVKVHFIRGIFTFSLHQTTGLHTKLYWKYQSSHIVELHSSHGRERQESEGGSELPCTPF